jgi:DNA-binding transcriptional ArsR family regulator
MRKSFQDLPVIDLSLRKFEKPSGSFKDLLRKFCISIGLLQPGDSRDVIVDLLALFIRSARQKKYLSANEVYKFIINNCDKGSSPSNTRRHLFRLKELDLVEKNSNGYRLREWLTLKELVSDLVNFKVKPTINRVFEYAEFIDSL